jgi:hypothetical protein
MEIAIPRGRFGRRDRTRHVDGAGGKSGVFKGLPIAALHDLLHARHTRDAKITDKSIVLDAQTLPRVQMPNRDGFS